MLHASRPAVLAFAALALDILNARRTILASFPDDVGQTAYRIGA
jgi:hypothetical protein